MLSCVASVEGAWQHVRSFAEESDPLRASIELLSNAELPATLVEEKIPIWFAIELACTSPTWRATVDEILSAVYRGVCLR